VVMVDTTRVNRQTGAHRFGSKLGRRWETTGAMATTWPGSGKQCATPTRGSDSRYPRQELNKSLALAKGNKPCKDKRVEKSRLSAAFCK
jgi:hypothetical protein